MTNPLDESAVPLILDEPKHGRVGGDIDDDTLFMSEPAS